MLGYTQSRVSIILGDARAAEAVEKYRQRVIGAIEDQHVRLRLLAVEAIDEIEEELRTCPETAIRQRAAFGVLDRSGYGKTETHLVASVDMTEAAAVKAIEAIREARALRGLDYAVGDVVEAEWTDVEAETQ